MTGCSSKVSRKSAAGSHTDALPQNPSTGVQNKTESHKETPNTIHQHFTPFKIPVYQSAWNGDFSELVTGTTAESPSVLAQPWGIKQGRSCWRERTLCQQHTRNRCETATAPARRHRRFLMEDLQNGHNPFCNLCSRAKLDPLQSKKWSFR